MDLVALLQMLLRRWYVTLPIVGFCLVVAVACEATRPPELQARGTVLLAGAEIDPLHAPETLDVSAVLTALLRPETADALTDSGVAFSARQLDDSRLEVTAVAESQEAAESTVKEAMQWVLSHVDELPDSEDSGAAQRLDTWILTPRVVAQARGDGIFEATGAVWIQRPQVDNPYTASEATGRLLAIAVGQDRDGVRVAEQLGDEVSFEIRALPRDAAPLINVTTTAQDEGTALAAFHVVVDAMVEELDSRQARAQVPASERVIIEVLAEPQSAIDVSRPVSRTSAAIVGLGGLLALVAGVVVEGASRRRSQEPGIQGDGWWSTPNVTTQDGSAVGPDGVEIAPGGSLSRKPDRS